jgi:1,4-alpha-glucan branching enzyme
MPRTTGTAKKATKKASTKRTTAKKKAATTKKATGTRKSAATRKRVTLQIQAEPKCEVFVAGTFNKWSPTKNRLKEKDGLFTTTLLLAKGRYEYKFIIDNVWCADPECPEWTPNDQGSLNSVINVT